MTSIKSYVTMMEIKGFAPLRVLGERLELLVGKEINKYDLDKASVFHIDIQEIRVFSLCISGCF